MVRGRHTIKTGFEESGYEESDFCFFICVAPLGSFTMSVQLTGTRGWNLPIGAYGQSPGEAYADFLLGYAAPSTYPAPSSQRSYVCECHAYVQHTLMSSP